MTEIRCATWNILAQRFWTNKPAATWPDRLAAILEKITEADASVVCLQEVELGTAAADFAPLFGRYGRFRHGDPPQKKQRLIGNMILWKKAEFICESARVNSTGVHVLLAHASGAKKVWFSNVHLRAGLYSQEDTRLCQLTSTLKLLSGAKAAQTPCCIVGDFNDDLQTDRKLHSLLTREGFVCADSPDSCCVVDRDGKSKFYAFDRVAATANVETKFLDNPRRRPIPDDTNPSDHLLLQFTVRRTVEK